jgi:hypothetical protein
MKEEASMDRVVASTEREKTWVAVAARWDKTPPLRSEMSSA